MTKSTRPLVMAHGLIGSLRDLVPVFSRHELQAYAPDLLGYGELRNVEVARIGLQAQVHHLKEWIDTRNFEQIDILGHSVGGATQPPCQPGRSAA